MCAPTLFSLAIYNWVKGRRGGWISQTIHLLLRPTIFLWFFFFFLLNSGVYVCKVYETGQRGVHHVTCLERCLLFTFIPLLLSSSLIRFSPPPLQIQAACSRKKKNLTKLETSWTQTKQKAKEREKKRRPSFFPFLPVMCLRALSLSFFKLFWDPAYIQTGKKLEPNCL